MPPPCVPAQRRPGEAARALLDSKLVRIVKRQILVDTEGLLMHAIVHAADIQDREGANL